MISLLIGCVLVSCSENVIENDIPQKDKETQITFSLDGLETSLSTRSREQLILQHIALNYLCLKELPVIVERFLVRPYPDRHRNVFSGRRY